MPVTVAAFRKLALALPEVTSAPHFDRLAFRTPRKIFATLSADGAEVNFLLEPELQAMLVANSKAFVQVKGKWGAQGATTCTLALATQAEVKQVLREAHSLARPLVTPRRARR